MPVKSTNALMRGVIFWASTAAVAVGFFAVFLTHSMSPDKSHYEIFTEVGFWALPMAFLGCIGALISDEL